MKNKLAYLISSFSFISLIAFSQPPGGHFYCLSGSNLAYGDWVPPYQDPAVTGPYVFKGYPTYSTPTYNWSAANQSLYPCYRFVVMTGGFGCKILQMDGSYISGTRGQFVYNITYCPLDEYVILMLIVSGIFGFLLIKRAFFLSIINTT